MTRSKVEQVCLGYEIRVAVRYVDLRLVIRCMFAVVIFPPCRRRVQRANVAWSKSGLFFVIVVRYIIFCARSIAASCVNGRDLSRIPLTFQFGSYFVIDLIQLSRRGVEAGIKLWVVSCVCVDVGVLVGFEVW